MNNKTLISVIIPAHNEQLNIALIYRALRDLFKTMKPYTYEIIMIDDGSRDDTLQVMKKIATKDANVQIVELVRNFGKEVATTAGLHHAHGDAAIMIDADMQHPPELIRDFLAKWEEGADVVVGVRETSTHQPSIIRRAGSRWFYRIMAVISDTVIKPNATDYRLVDRVVIEEFNRFTERNRVTRGLIDWLGFTHDYVYFKPAKRANGTAAYSYFKLVNLALHSIVSMSFVPLRIAGWLGGVIVLVSGPIGVFIFFESYVYHDPLNLHISGPATLGVVLLFLVGIILICLGLIALYIANIYGEVVNRPLYVERRQRHRK